MKIKLKNVRLSFHDLLKTDDFDRYGVNVILAKDHPQIADLENAMLEVATETWGAAAESKLSGEGNFFFKEGDLVTDKKGNTYSGFEGQMAVVARNKSKAPTLVDVKGRVTKDPALFYSGCYVNLIIDVKAFTFKNVTNIHASLLGVQFLKDGDSFGQVEVSDESDFDDLSEPSDSNSDFDDMMDD